MIHSSTYGTLLLCLALTASIMASSSRAANRWIAGGATNLWTDVDNWSEGVAPPDATTNPNAWDDHEFFGFELTPNDPTDDFPRFVNEAQLTEEGTTTLIDDSVVAETFGLYVGLNGATNELEMTGGTLEVGGWHLNIGRVFNKSGDPNAKATFNMSGGTVNTGLVKIPEQFVDNSLADPGASAPLNGELIMTGGTLNTVFMNVGQLEGNGTVELSGSAELNLVTGDLDGGGFFRFNGDWNVGGVPRAGTGTVNVDVSENAIIEVFGHIDMFITTPDESEVARYQGYVDSGELTADEGTDDPTIYLGADSIKICALDADFDGDCDTDADDFATWEANYGMTGVAGDLKAIGDADNDGDVDGADFLELQKEYGVGTASPLAGVATVPEPASIGLLALAGAAASTCRLRVNRNGFALERK